ncbi:MAG: exopolyphosphatase [Hungatella sp.]
MATHLFAAIDVGSFELELGIYEMSTKYGMRQVDHLRHMIALGKDTYNSGKISYELVDELCRILGQFSSVMESYKVEAYHAYATSAMREAKNNQIILDQILVRTGILVKVISNSEQRFLSYKAIATSEAEFSKIIQKGTAIVDVGFGSMQLSLFDKDSLISTQNLRLGVLRIRELLSRIQTETKTHYSQIEEMVDNELATYKKLYLKDREIQNLIGIGESILYLFRRADATKPTDRVNAADFKKFCERLITLSLDQIEDEFGVNEEYASLLIPSAIIYKQALELTGAEMLWIPGIRLCDGIAAEYAEQIKQIRFTHSFDDDILAASRNMSKRYRCHTNHIQNIEGYVLMIFDSMRRYHGLGSRERLLLQIATILHDCGKFISMKTPSLSAYNLILSTEIIGLSHMEREIIANVVRYNLEEFDYNQVHLDGHESADATILIAKLTAMLSLANAMDRSHLQKMEGCKFNIKGGLLQLTTEYEGDLSLENIAILQSADFFEEIFGVRPALKQKRRV